jgi:hypothetical protein
MRCFFGVVVLCLMLHLGCNPSSGPCSQCDDDREACEDDCTFLWYSGELNWETYPECKIQCWNMWGICRDEHNCPGSSPIFREDGAYLTAIVLDHSPLVIPQDEAYLMVQARWAFFPESIPAVCDDAAWIDLQDTCTEPVLESDFPDMVAIYDLLSLEGAGEMSEIEFATYGPGSGWFEIGRAGPNVAFVFRWDASTVPPDDYYLRVRFAEPALGPGGMEDDGGSSVPMDPPPLPFEWPANIGIGEAFVVPTRSLVCGE